ncbi:hypothetical protein BDP27DRAFT_1330428 [Rhodocollybia butyracea]|uniref:Uncharacterized protein n=1 Tax=Rhodocollybia butyracea TaxID=206335 RepID=A0A9P5PNK3_9AGAR|nr:hypothetical protein BDP27DRAFT_1330428 [Rhodocollybia butyracea]
MHRRMLFRWTSHIRFHDLHQWHRKRSHSTTRHQGVHKPSLPNSRHKLGCGCIRLPSCQFKRGYCDSITFGFRLRTSTLRDHFRSLA